MPTSHVWLIALVLLVPATLHGEGPLQIVATLQPLGWIASDVAGERAQVTVLVPPGASPHSFEPRPSDVARAARARIVLVAGGGLDDWAHRLLDAAGGDAEVLDLTTLAGAPHAWLDPPAVRERLVPALAAALTRVDPDGGPDYTHRAAALRTRLDALDAELRAILQGAGRRPYVAFHAGWSPFAARYGLRQVGVIQDTPSEDPSPRHLARVLAAAREADARAILVEPQLDPRIASTLAREFSGETILVDPLGDATDPERGDYAALLRFNARAFARATGDSR